MAVLIAGIFAFVFCAKNSEKFLKIFGLFFSVYFSHLLIDFFAVDNSFPYGEQLLWPFTSEYYLSPVPIFMDVHKSDVSFNFIQSLFSKHNFIMVLSEIGIFGTYYLIVEFIKKNGFLSVKLENR